MTQFSPKKQLEIIELAEKAGMCKGNLDTVKEYFAQCDSEGVMRIFRGNHVWLKESLNVDIPLDGKGELRYESGRLAALYEYKAGKLNGTSIGWHDKVNGNPAWRKKYKSGKLWGISEIWFENGQIKLLETYRDGVFDGERSLWAESGRWMCSGKYKRGVLVSGEHF